MSTTHAQDKAGCIDVPIIAVRPTTLQWAASDGGLR